MKFRPWLFLALGILLLSAAPARAQYAQLGLEPPLSEAMPLAGGPDGVHVEMPVLLNDHTILRPQATLHFVYIENNPGAHPHDDDNFPTPEEGPHALGGTLTRNDNASTAHGESASLWGGQSGDPDAAMFDQPEKNDPKKTQAELRQEIWRDKEAFVEAFTHASETGTTLVYGVAGQARPMTSDIDLPEGMLLAEAGGHVRVLGVAAQSRAHDAGIEAGDEIRAFNGGPPLATLDDFIRAYAAARHQAKATGNSAYELDVWSPSQGRVLPMRLAAPPSIPSFL